jgi:hypothetical protein
MCGAGAGARARFRSVQRFTEAWGLLAPERQFRFFEEI